MNWVGPNTPLNFSKDLSIGPLPPVGIEDLLPSSEGYFAFYDPESPISVLSALDAFDEYVTQEDSFDGVIGFSQGAALAAMLMIRRQSSTSSESDEPFRFAVFICAAVPHKEASLRRGMVEFLDPATDGEPVKVPTTNIVGGKDPHVANGITLSHLCQDRGKVLSDHEGGHDIPRHPKDITAQMAQAILDTIQKALFVQ